MQATVNGGFEFVAHRGSLGPKKQVFVMLELGQQTPLTKVSIDIE